MTEIIGPILARGQPVDISQNINLTVQFKDSSGNPVNTDITPTISLIQPSGAVALAQTTTGVTNVGLGQYSFIYTIPFSPGAYGVWNDVWTATINGFQVQATFSFIVSHTDLPSINSDGYIKLGDDPGFNYSQTALSNINKLLKMLKSRLNSSGKSRKVVNGNVTYIDCDIYSIEMLTTFLAMALSDFNQTPYFTFITFDQTSFIDQFAEVLVEGATLYALSSQALIERGREFQLTDAGLNFNPPSVAEMLNTQYSTLLAHYNERLKYIKNSLRPYPLGLGIFSMSSGLIPAIRNLARLRERRIL